jgi:hypothetical protein
VTTIRTYVDQMTQAQRLIARSLGCDVDGSAKELRVAVISTDVLIATLVRCLADKGLITDADLRAALAVALSEVWPDQPVNPSSP